MKAAQDGRLPSKSPGTVSSKSREPRLATGALSDCARWHCRRGLPLACHRRPRNPLLHLSMSLDSTLLNRICSNKAATAVDMRARGAKVYAQDATPHAQGAHAMPRAHPEAAVGGQQHRPNVAW